MSKKVTTHSKIMKLHKTGMSHSQISKKLGIRYQHSYNSVKRQNEIDLRESRKESEEKKDKS